MRPNERREMIRKKNTELSLTRQCKLLKISHSSIYYTPVGLDQATLDLLHEMNRIFTKYPYIHEVSILWEPPDCDLSSSVRLSAGRHRVRRLTNIMGLQGPSNTLWYKGPNTSKKHPEHRIYPYSLRKLPIMRPNQGSQLQAPAGSKL